MKKKRSRTRSARSRKPTRAERKLVQMMAAQGRVEDEIAQVLDVDKSTLRRQHIDSIKAGKAQRVAAREVLNGLTMEEYHFLDTAADSFASHWFDPETGNDLFPGMDGHGAKNIDDAFAAWKRQGGKYITTGLGAEFDPEKVAAFSKIVAAYRDTFERGK